MITDRYIMFVRGAINSSLRYTEPASLPVVMVHSFYVGNRLLILQEARPNQILGKHPDDYGSVYHVRARSN